MLLALLQFFSAQLLYLALHLESGSFPRPLTPKEEAAAFAALRAGDPAAWETIIQHNLRLVAHGGQDYLVESAGLKYLVSCKHYIKSGKHVGQDDEQNISDRLLQFNATGFIGFYSTGITTGLQKRLDGICNNRQYNYLIFGPQEITQIMQSMDTKILQSFGLYPNKYYMNVSRQNYQPLKYVCCGKDILADENIPNSIAGLAEYKDGTYGYVYGCKPCLLNVKLYLGAFLEIEPALHIKWLQDWERTVDEWIAEDKLLLRNDFYQMRYKFAQGVRQRQLPQTDGTWYGLEPDDF